MGVPRTWIRKQSSANRPRPTQKRAALGSFLVVSLLGLPLLAAMFFTGPTSRIHEVVCHFLPGEIVLLQESGCAVETAGVFGRQTPAGLQPIGAPAEEGYVLFGWLDTGLTLWHRPGEQMRFGEAWEIAAFDGSACRLWETKTCGIPFISCHRDNRLLVGVRNTCSGGAPALLEIDPWDGRVKWETSFEEGLWRAVGFAPSGEAIAMFDGGVAILGSNGAIIREYGFKVKVSCAIVGDEEMFISFPANRMKDRLQMPFVLQALSFGGEIVWSSCLPGEPHRITLGRRSGCGNDAVVALLDSCMIGFSMEDGGWMFAETVEGRPVGFVDGFLLVHRHEGFLFMKMDDIVLPVGSNTP